MKYSIYDNGGITADRYTAVPEGAGWHPVRNRYGQWQYTALALNDFPTHPSYGFSQFTECTKGKHLGKKIPFESLPENVQKHIIARCEV